MNDIPISAALCFSPCACHQTYPCLDDLRRYNLFVIDFLPGRKMDVVRLLRSKTNLSLLEINTNLGRNSILIGKNLLKEECDQLGEEFKSTGAQIKFDLNG